MSIAWKTKRFIWRIRKYLDNHTKIRIGHKKYNGKAILDIRDCNNEIISLIESGKPFAVGRLGDMELRAIVSCQPENKSKEEKSRCFDYLSLLAGFFGDINDFDIFSRLMEDKIHSVDLMGVWFNKMEDWILKKYGDDNLKYGLLEGLEPWYTPDNPWSKALKGRKVLCIHPFAESIERQYKYREELFKGSDILPEFELICLKAVQTIGNEKDDRFSTWFEALDYMYKEAMKTDFDIALIACGAYGLPLAAMIKEGGRQAIHMGGAMQLLFGIKGKRWDDFGPLNGFYNEYWKYPDEAEKPEGIEKIVEGGCYW